jgi:16S rRNA (cytosine1407-C5)-methyltransferase
MSESFPHAFLERLEAIVPEERLADVNAALRREHHTAFRINTLLAEPAPVLAQLERDGFELTALEWLPGAYAVVPEQRRALTESAAFQAGHLYIQNPASMLPPLLLMPSVEERVLDLAAAPGSKTLQLAAMMGNEGWISAVEVVRQRFFRLRANLERHGAKNVHTYNKDGSGVWRLVPEQFDKVLLDAPCSSEGQFNLQQPESYRYWSEKKIKEMVRKQKRLLYSAIQCLKPGGEMIYSTCTFAPEENEGVVNAMLRKFKDTVSVAPIMMAIPGAMNGLTQWRGKAFHSELAKAVRVLPDRYNEGFFVCRLRKAASG